MYMCAVGVGEEPCEGVGDVYVCVGEGELIQRGVVWREDELVREEEGEEEGCAWT